MTMHASNAKVLDLLVDSSIRELNETCLNTFQSEKVKHPEFVKSEPDEVPIMHQDSYVVNSRKLSKSMSKRYAGISDSETDQSSKTHNVFAQKSASKNKDKPIKNYYADYRKTIAMKTKPPKPYNPKHIVYPVYKHADIPERDHVPVMQRKITKLFGFCESIERDCCTSLGENPYGKQIVIVD